MKHRHRFTVKHRLASRQRYRVSRLLVFVHRRTDLIDDAVDATNSDCSARGCQPPEHSLDRSSIHLETATTPKITVYARCEKCRLARKAAASSRECVSTPSQGWRGCTLPGEGSIFVHCAFSSSPSVENKRFYFPVTGYSFPWEHRVFSICRATAATNEFIARRDRDGSNYCF